MEIAMASDNGRSQAGKHLNEQFNSSLRRWSASHAVRKRSSAPFSLTDPLQRVIDESVRELLAPDPTSFFHESLYPITKILRETGQGESLALAFRALLHFRAREILKWVEFAVASCETAIEVPMLLALVIVGKALARRVVFGDREDEASGPCTLSIQPQEDVGQYRVDFLLTLTYAIRDSSSPNILPSGKKLPGFRNREKQMIVECDGHDFHDRTKEQARKDRSRDRALQSLGYKVFRYTGSEIWSDVFKCAHEAVAALLKEMDKDRDIAVRPRS
jgi:very-short-patch-repair endonuclease